MEEENTGIKQMHNFNSDRFKDPRARASSNLERLAPKNRGVNHGKVLVLSCVGLTAIFASLAVLPTFPQFERLRRFLSPER